MTGESEAARMLRRQREWEQSKKSRSAILAARPTDAPAPNSGQPKPPMSTFAKLAIAAGMIIAGTFFVNVFDSHAAPECKGNDPSLFNTEILVNSCDRSVVASVCAEYLFGQSGGTCSSARYYKPGESFALVPTEDANILMSVITPMRTIIFICEEGYKPVDIDRSFGKYRCERFQLN